MNRRYRRQMALRSRSHRTGGWRACGCHAYRVPEQPRRVVPPHLDTFCDPVWQLRRDRPIHDLPDLSLVTEAMVKLAPVAATAATYFEKLREAYDAEPSGPES
jgi:hypothetical protein